MATHKKYIAKVSEKLEGYIVLTSESDIEANHKINRLLTETGFRSTKFVVEDRETNIINLEEIDPHNTVEDLYRILNKEFNSSELKGYDAYKKHQELKELQKGETLTADPDSFETLQLNDTSKLVLK